MTNSPQSQDELDEILNSIESPEWANPDYETELAKAKQALLAWRRTTSLLALPEKKKIPQLTKDTTVQEQRDFGWNKAIDLTKKNIEEQL